MWVTNDRVSDALQSPAQNILVENIYCNWSGGCGMGSLGADTNISDITYRNVYTWNSNQMMLIKSNGGSGTVSNVVLENFIGKRQPESSLIPTANNAQATATPTPSTSIVHGAA